jgi:hypothetical protein
MNLNIYTAIFFLSAGAINYAAGKTNQSKIAILIFNVFVAGFYLAFLPFVNAV